MHEADLDLVTLQLPERLGEGFERTVDVGLDDQVERGRLARWIWSKMSSSLRRRQGHELAAERRLTLPVLTGVGHPAGHLLIRRDDELPAGVGDLGEAEDLTGVDGPASLTCSP